jgi:hypothetical protein
MRYIFAKVGETYHDRNSLTERCNTDSIKERKESDTPPLNRRLCVYCQKQGEYEHKMRSM